MSTLQSLTNKVKAWIAKWRSRPNFEETTMSLAARAVSNYPNMKYEHVSYFFLSSKLELLHELNRITTIPNHCYINSIEIMRIAAKLDATHVIIFHVHPTGDLELTSDDIVVRDHIASVLETIDCQLEFLLLAFKDNKFQVLMPDGTHEEI